MNVLCWLLKSLPCLFTGWMWGVRLWILSVHVCNCMGKRRNTSSEFLLLFFPQEITSYSFWNSVRVSNSCPFYFISFSDPTLPTHILYFMRWFSWIVVKFDTNHNYQTWWQLFRKSNWIATEVYMLGSICHVYMFWNSNVGSWLASGGEYITVYSL